MNTKHDEEFTVANEVPDFISMANQATKESKDDEPQTDQSTRK